MGLKEYAIVILILVLVEAIAYGTTTSTTSNSVEEKGKGNDKGAGPFILDQPTELIRTKAGLVQSFDGPGILSHRENIQINFIILEPCALLIPLYFNGDSIFLLNKGRVTLSWVAKNDEEEESVDLEEGDVYKVDGGTVVYLRNFDDSKRVEIFSIFDNTKASEKGTFEPFFVAGGSDPSAVLSGFDPIIIAAAMNVPVEDLKRMLSFKSKGPIIYMNSCSKPSLLRSVLDMDMDMGMGMGMGMRSSIKPYNILSKAPDFQNDNGWTLTVTGDDYQPLKSLDISIFAVHLNPGSILSPHWNSVGTEIAYVRDGKGMIQISHPNGTTALDSPVEEGSVFLVPQFYPMCQIASLSAPFEFIGVATTAKKSDPNFIAGATSVLKALNPDVLSASFGWPSEDAKEMLHLLDSQKDSVILSQQTHE